MKAYIMFIAVFSVSTYLFGDSAGFRRTYRPYGEKFGYRKPSGWPLSRVRNKELFCRYCKIILALTIIDLAWIMVLCVDDKQNSMHLYLNAVQIPTFIIGYIFGCLRCRLKIKRKCEMFGLSFPDMKPLGNT